MERPQPTAWPEEISVQEFERFVPDKIELVDGKLLDSEEARLDLLAVLLKNCGLEAAALMCDRFHWREAAARAGHDL